MNVFPIPKILQCHHFIANSTSHDARIVRDYEFDFYLDGERSISIDERRYKTSKGCLIFRKPGQLAQGVGNYNMYTLTLDFSHKCKLLPGKYLRSSNTPQQELCTLDVLNEIPDAFYPYHQDEFITLYQKLCKCSYPNLIDEKQQKQLIAEFLFLVLADAYRYNRDAFHQEATKKPYVEQACQYITKNYAKAISVTDVAEHLSLNKNYLIKLFKNKIGTTPNQYLAQTRLFYAKLMLMQTDLSVETIGFSCGFNDASYFIKCFREFYGVSPLAYRKNHSPSV